MFYAEGNDLVEDNTDDEWTKWITINYPLLRGEHIFINSYSMPDCVNGFLAALKQEKPPT